MTHIRADIAGPAEADLGIHVRAVHVNLSTVAVDDVADVFDSRFEHAVRAGVCDHDGGEIFRVLSGLFLQVGDVDVAVIVARNGHHFQSRNYRAGGVGPVRAGGDQADRAVRFIARFVIGANHQQPRVLALALPALGCSDTPANPVISASQSSNCLNRC